MFEYTRGLLNHFATYGYRGTIVVGSRHVNSFYILFEMSNGCIVRVCGKCFGAPKGDGVGGMYWGSGTLWWFVGSHFGKFISSVPGVCIFVKQLWKESDICKNSLPSKLLVLVEGKTLPTILHTQMDNCAKDKKCKYVFCFLWFLMAQGIFKEVYVSFWWLGAHTTTWSS